MHPAAAHNGTRKCHRPFGDIEVGRDVEFNALESRSGTESAKTETGSNRGRDRLPWSFVNHVRSRSPTYGHSEKATYSAIPHAQQLYRLERE
jgi:hypothetical protein